jgi:hypothetical protein
LHGGSRYISAILHSTKFKRPSSSYNYSSALKYQWQAEQKQTNKQIKINKIQYITRETMFWYRHEFAGSNPAEAVGFFWHPENPQYAFLRRGSKIVCPMSKLCGM